MSDKLFVSRENFFSAEELEDIRNKVFSLKNHWYTPHISGQRDDYIHINFLPKSMYIAPVLGVKHYLEDIKSKKEIMYENFGVYYEKVRNETSKILGIPIEYHENASYPGFPIYTNTTDSRKEYTSVHYHADIIMVPDIIPEGKVCSINIPITSPKNGTGLLYKHNDKEHFLPYTPGELRLWNGTLPHSAGTFILEDSSDYRLTMQSFVSVKDGIGYIFW